MSAETDTEPEVRLVALMLCDLCLDGDGGECHVPGCAMYLNRAPDLSLREKVVANLTVESVAPHRDWGESWKAEAATKNYGKA